MKINEITFLNIIIIPSATITLVATGFIFGLGVKESQFKVKDSLYWVGATASAGVALSITTGLVAYESGKRIRNQNINL